MYNKSGPSAAPVQVAMTEEQEEEEEKSLLQNDDLIKVEGTRVMFSKNLVEQWVVSSNTVYWRFVSHYMYISHVVIFC